MYDHDAVEIKMVEAAGEALDRAAQWVRDEVDRIRRQRGLPGLLEPWHRPPCPHCEGTGYIPIGTDIDGYHWVRRCVWCNPDPPQGQAGCLS